MTNKKSQYVPLLVDRLDIGESTAWLWLKSTGNVTDDTKKAFARIEHDVKRLLLSTCDMRKNVKSNQCLVTETEKQLLDCKPSSETACALNKQLKEHVKQLEISRGDLNFEVSNLNSANHRLTKLNASNCQYLYRRVQAAITAERTDWTPIEDVAGHLSSQFGVTVKQVAEWYGYNPHSLYGIIGEGRFVGKRPKRALTLIDYYLKENELC